MGGTWFQSQAFMKQKTLCLNTYCYNQTESNSGFFEEISLKERKMNKKLVGESKRV